ncbi:MAG: hypothetical protein R6V57_10130 [Vicinamibacterales bacterium]
MRALRVSAAAALVAAAWVAAMSAQGKPGAPAPGDLDGTWTLNRELSQFPREVGFGMDVTGAGRPATGEARMAGGEDPGLVANRPASREEAENSRQLVAEVRNPPARLTIAQRVNAITVTDERGRARTYHPDGREAFTPLDAAPVATVSRWDGGRLVIRYKVEPGREVRYTVSRRASPPQLVVQAELLERGGRDTVVRVYEPASADDPLPAAPAPAERAPQQAPPVIPLPSQRPGAAAPPPPAPADPVRPMVPAVPSSAAPANLDQTPGAELKGLSALGIVVEDLGAEAASCGLRQEAIEAAAAKSLTAAGLKVLRNTDEDTHLYIRVVTAATTSGTCFSRYDAFVYSYTAATLSYGSRPALVQVSLLNRGGLAASAAKGHGDAVTRAITQYVDQFAAEIRDANR